MSFNEALERAKAIAAKLKRPAQDDEEVYNPEKFKRIDDPTKFGLSASSANKSFDVQVLSRMIPAIVGRNEDNIKRIESGYQVTIIIGKDLKQEFRTISIVGDGIYILLAFIQLDLFYRHWH